jgi:hypothetical protein
LAGAPSFCLRVSQKSADFAALKLLSLSYNFASNSKLSNEIDLIALVQ